MSLILQHHRHLLGCVFIFRSLLYLFISFHLPICIHVCSFFPIFSPFLYHTKFHWIVHSHQIIRLKKQIKLIFGFSLHLKLFHCGFSKWFSCTYINKNKHTQIKHFEHAKTKPFFIFLLCLINEIMLWKFFFKVICLHTVLQGRIYMCINSHKKNKKSNNTLKWPDHRNLYLMQIGYRAFFH